MQLYSCNLRMLDLCDKLLIKSKNFGFAPFNGCRRTFDDEVILNEPQIQKLLKMKPPKGKTTVEKITKLAGEIEKMTCLALEEYRADAEDDIEPDYL